MNTTQYAQMVKTHIAPCGCPVEITGDTTSVLHTCVDRKPESDAANKAAVRNHAERSERKQLLSEIPLGVLREMVHGKPRATTRA